MISGTCHDPEEHSDGIPESHFGIFDHKINPDTASEVITSIVVLFYSRTESSSAKIIKSVHVISSSLWQNICGGALNCLSAKKNHRKTMDIRYEDKD